MAAHDDPAVVRRAQIVDVVRSAPLGVTLALESSLLVTVALKHFDAPGWVKGVVAAGPGVGMLLSPLVTSLARRSGRPAMVVAALVSAVGALGFAAATSNALWLFAVGAVVGIAAIDSIIPLQTVTYQRNFPPGELGQRVGRGMTLKVLVTAVVGLALGGLLRDHPTVWWAVPAAGLVACAAVAALSVQVPSDPLPRVPGVRNTIWPHFHLLGQDRQLRLTLAAWMFMGFGNLMLLPLRVEYLGQPRYGINADAAKIALLTVFVPSIVRLVAMPVFGRVFDRMSFFAARILVNVFFALYVAAFFTGTSDAGLLTGAVILGIGSAGGDLMWSLWVTKFAPEGRTADYMGLHTFFTGIRAVAAPVVAFAIVGRVSLSVVALAAAAMMVVASAVLVPEARAERHARLAAATPSA